MRQGNHARLTDDGFGREVDDVLAQPTGLQGSQHRRGIAQLGAGEVQQRRRGLHLRQHLLVDHVAGLLGKRNVHRDIIRFGQHCVQRSLARWIVVDSAQAFSTEMKGS